MKLIALDTCTEACSAALWLDGELVERYQIAPREHTNLILPMLDELFAETQLSLTSFDAIAFGRGPGAFTGVRIGIGVVQGLAFAGNLPVVPVSTLAALAQEATAETTAETLLSVIDARMEEVYWGLYRRNESGLVIPVLDEGISSPDGLPQLPGEELFGVGSGWGSYPQQLAVPLGQRLYGYEAERFPRARAIARLAAAAFSSEGGIAAELAEPIYLRDKVAKTLKERGK